MSKQDDGYTIPDEAVEAAKARFTEDAWEAVNAERWNDLAIGNDMMFLLAGFEDEASMLEQPRRGPKKGWQDYVRALVASLPNPDAN